MLFIKLQTLTWSVNPSWIQIQVVMMAERGEGDGMQRQVNPHCATSSCYGTETAWLKIVDFQVCVIGEDVIFFLIRLDVLKTLRYCGALHAFICVMWSKVGDLECHRQALGCMLSSTH